MFIDKIQTNESIIYGVNLSNKEIRQQLEDEGIDLLPIVKQETKKNIDKYTESYINQMFEQQQENLADIVSEQGVIEGRFYIAGFSPEQVRNEIFLIITGQKTRDEVITELSIPAELEPQLDRAIEIAKLIYWKEQIWEEEANLEAQIDTMTLEELLSLDVKTMCENAYEVIQV